MIKFSEHYQTWRNYKKDRDRAFDQFVKDDDFTHIIELLDKYEIELNYPSEEIARWAFYKAVQECENIAPSVKEIARKKASQIRRCSIYEID